MRIKRGMISYVKPVYIDSESSPTTVYINKNIREDINQTLEIETGKFKDTPIYVYDMYIYTRDEFELVEQFLENDELLHTAVNDVKNLKAENKYMKDTIEKLISEVNMLKNK